MLTPTRTRTRTRTPRTSRIRGVFTGVTRVVPAFVAFVLLVDVAVAGGSYVYCASMETVMPHPCCAQHAKDSPSPVAVLSARITCCQLRELCSLDQASATPRAAQLVPPIACVSTFLLDAFPTLPSLGRLLKDPALRAPPRSLALTRRVVMQV